MAFCCVLDLAKFNDSTVFTAMRVEQYADKVEQKCVPCEAGVTWDADWTQAGSGSKT